jgi:hypothetical protein
LLLKLAYVPSEDMRHSELWLMVAERHSPDATHAGGYAHGLRGQAALACGSDRRFCRDLVGDVFIGEPCDVTAAHGSPKYGVLGYFHVKWNHLAQRAMHSWWA